MNKTKLPPPKETEITKAILSYLRDCCPHIMAWKQWQGPFSAEGVSDILGIFAAYPVTWDDKKGDWKRAGKPIGKFLAIEVKTPKGKVSAAQQGFIDNVNEKGGLAFVARSLEDVIEKLPRGI